MAVTGLLPPPLFLLAFMLLHSMACSASDYEALLKLKKSLTNKKALDSWAPNSKPCDGKTRWDGVVCYTGIVTALRLGGMGLSGKIDVEALSEIRGIRTLSLTNNSFSGSIPEFNRLGTLKAIYLSGNQFSGEIAPEFFVKMESLKKVWLSHNNFTGKIPSSLANLPRLVELHLENNQFNGAIPPFGQSKMKRLDVSNNNLEGEIPASLSKFNASFFAGNPGLCGEILGKVCAPPAEANPDPELSASKSKQEGYTKAAATMLTIAAVVFVLMAIAIIVLKRREEKFDVLGRENFDESVEVHVSGSNRKETDASRRSTSASQKGSSRGKGTGAGAGTGTDLVVVNDDKGVFGLQELMKAAAEVLGNGNMGSSYKALMSNGVTVVAKRMKEMHALGKDSFDAEIQRLGKLRHLNILTPLAYHYRKEEKLLISEYIPKGSLLYLLHGDRGPLHTDLDWPVRLKIVHGIARGLGYLHVELASFELPHGNLKSSNILLSSNYEPLLADYALSPLMSTAQATQVLFAYKSPEALQHQQVSPKCDVYCLGVVILEILTGKFPSQYLNNGKGGTDVVQWVVSAIVEGREADLLDPEITSSKESLREMERLLHIGASCTESNPEKRLDMKEAIQRIEEIHIGGQEARNMQLPSLRDGCAELTSSQSQVSSSQRWYGEASGRRTGLTSFDNRSGYQSTGSFAFDIS